MAHVCSLCEEELGTLPTTELVCHHFFHTHCFFQRFYQVQNGVCPDCGEYLVPQQVEEVVEDERTRISNLYDIDKKMRTLLQNYKASYREVYKARRHFLQLLKRKKEYLHGCIEPLIAQVREYHRQTKHDVLISQEYRTYHSHELRCNTILNRLRRDYRLSGNSFHHLRTKHGMKTLRRFHYSSYSSIMIRRSLRVRAYFR
jgi:hypothetical protein